MKFKTNKTNNTRDYIQKNYFSVGFLSKKSEISKQKIIYKIKQMDIFLVKINFYMQIISIL